MFVFLYQFDGILLEEGFNNFIDIYILGSFFLVFVTNKIIKKKSFMRYLGKLNKMTVVKFNIKKKH